ncbi:MAG: CBS domain-containing protein [Myxococcota bacterium]
MKIRDVMTTGVLVAEPHETVRSVVIKMLSRHCGSIPIVGDEQELLGIVTVRDVLLPLYPNYGDYVHDNVRARSFLDMEDGYPKVLDQQVGEIMSRKPYTVAPDAPVLEAASYMGLRSFRRIPVVEDGKLVGVVSIGDINRGLFFSMAD